jgi:hypothetical protein
MSVKKHDKRPDEVTWQWFDYAEVPTSVSKFLKAQVDRIRRSAGKSVIEIGKDLIAAKHYLSHGAFLRWVEYEVGIPARTAQGYMQVAQWASGKNNCVARLPPTILYLLSAPSTPKDLVHDILEKADSGENISLSDLREELKGLRAKAQKAQRNMIDTNQPIEADVTSRQISERVDGSVDVQDAVAILVRALPLSVFCRVRDIMTNNRVLTDPCLAQKIALAFLTPGEIEGASDYPGNDCKTQLAPTDINVDLSGLNSDTGTAAD